MTLHAINHSLGLVFTQHDPGHHEFSFAVDADGGLPDGENLGGWGFAGPPGDTGHFVNAPPDPLAVHTVLVESDSVETLVALRALIEEHNERYAACQVWVAAGSSRDLVNWARAGCPPPNEVAVPTDEELRAADHTDVLVADDHFSTTSEPVSDPVSLDDVEAAVKAELAEKVAKARADHERRKLQAELEELGETVDFRLGVERLREQLAEAKTKAAAKAAKAEAKAAKAAKSN